MIEELKDAHLIQRIMYEAFEEYRLLPIPSSALKETIEEIEKAIASGERSFGYREKEHFIALIRYSISGDILKFRRLSVLPPYRGRGYATQLIRQVEQKARAQNVRVIQCAVRQHLPKNIALYRSLGYRISSQDEIVRGSVVLPIVHMEKLLSYR